MFVQVLQWLHTCSAAASRVTTYATSGRRYRAEGQQRLHSSKEISPLIRQTIVAKVYPSALAFKYI